ncbi:MAG: cytidylate kinase family protein [Candidatus Aenigmatarchaeota archaeon]|nr:MAG: cytidylate kinase family protein [Candidatus Aenigmarchaeota archaeon]
MIITISGLPGSGKSSVAKLLAKRLKMKRYYMGEMRREIARKRGITLEELNRLGEKKEWTDKTVDDYQRELGKKEDNFIIEGRTSFFFIPNSIKIFLDVDIKTGAERIFKVIENEGANQRNEGDFKTIDEAEKAIRERIRSDRKRYKKYYGIDFLDRSHYDMVIDTTDLKISQVVEKIIRMIEKRKQK